MQQVLAIGAGARASGTFGVLYLRKENNPAILICSGLILVTLDLHQCNREQNLALNIGRHGRNWGRVIFFLTDKKSCPWEKVNGISKAFVAPSRHQPGAPMPISLSFFFFPVCTQLLVSRPDEENISSYLQLIDKCLIHEVSRDGSSKTVVLIT